MSDHTQGILSGLAPEHLADLRKSGLTDATIAVCEFKAVPPNMLRILKGIESAYEIPYFTLDNSRNCFARWKLFYESDFIGERKKKYHQKQGSGVEVYLPPMIEWKKVAADPSILVCVIEGEKKALALAQIGYPSIGVGGVWNHHDHDNSGQSLLVPAFTMFAWKSRKVELVCDSDGWRPEKFKDVVGGMYALGMELTRQGANVEFVRIPEPQGVKVGADDFLVQAKHLQREEWTALERIPIGDRRLDAVATDYQRRTEKRRAQESLREGVAEKLTLSELAGTYTVKSANHQTTIIFDRITTKGAGLVAEVTITTGGIVLRSGTDLNLKSESMQNALAKNLAALTDAVPWKWLLPRACAMALARHREGTPLVRIDQHRTCEPLTFVINPLVVKRKATVLFADGGKGKSTLALLCCMLVSTGGRVAGLSALKGHALFLDYEDDEDVHTRRYHAILAGHPELAGAVFDYYRPSDRLARCIPEVARKISECQASLLVIDSLLLAAGNGSDAEATESLFMALRRFDLPSLIIGHVPKLTKDNKDRPTIYGSVFNSNLARNTFELETEQELGDDTAVLALHHRKSNLTRKHPPIGLQVTHKPDGSYVRYETANLEDVPEMAKALPIPARIRNLLEDGVHRTAKQVATDLDLPLDKVKSPISKGVKCKKWMEIRQEGQEVQYTALNPRHEGGS